MKLQMQTQLADFQKQIILEYLMSKLSSREAAERFGGITHQGMIQLSNRVLREWLRDEKVVLIFNKHL